MRRRPRSPDSPPHQSLLPEAELEVLAVLRTAGEATAAEVREGLAPFRPMSHASVSTLLARLGRKRLVRRRKATVGKAYLYSASAGSSKPFGREVERVVKRLFGGDSADLFASLLGEHEPSRDELERLKGLVDELWREREGEEEP